MRMRNPYTRCHGIESKMNGLQVIILSAYTSLILGQGYYPENGELRLMDRWRNSTGISHGCLEIYISANRQWKTICSMGFGMAEADIACRQLNFSYASRSTNLMEVGWPPLFDQLGQYGSLSCSSGISRLINCHRRTHSCDRYHDVVVSCAHLSDPVRLVSQTGRNRSLSAGRLEIFINNTWGTICADSFTLTDAHVACRQLGFIKANSYHSVSSIGLNQVSPAVPIWLDEINCSSNMNNNLRLCSHNGTGKHNCDHSKDVLVSCIRDGALRLVGSSSSNMLQSGGRLEIYYNGEWGTMCDDGFGNVEANASCRQLGFTGYIKRGNVGNLGYNRGTGRILLDGVICPSSDTPLVHCRHNGWGTHNCRHDEDVALECLQTSSSGGGGGLQTSSSGGGGGGGGSSNSSIGGGVGGNVGSSSDIPVFTIIGGTLGGMILIGIFVMAAFIGCKTMTGHHTRRQPHNTTAVPARAPGSFSMHVAAARPYPVQQYGQPSYTNPYPPPNPDNKMPPPPPYDNPLQGYPQGEVVAYPVPHPQSPTAYQATTYTIIQHSQSPSPPNFGVPVNSAQFLSDPQNMQALPQPHNSYYPQLPSPSPSSVEDQQIEFPPPYPGNTVNPPSDTQPQNYKNDQENPLHSPHADTDTDLPDASAPPQ